MRLLFIEHFRTATESLRRARARTLLTITGVAIGVASITTILALSSGVTDIIQKQITELGDRVLLVRPATPPLSVSDLSSPTAQTTYTTSPLTERDLETIQKTKGVYSATPLMTLSGSVRTKDRQSKNSIIAATTPELLDTTKLEVREGQFIDPDILENTVVVGSQLSIDLFGTEKSVGQTLLVKGQSFTVIGVLKEQNAPVNFNNIDFDQAVIISLESGKLFNNSLAQIQQINILAKPGADTTTLQQKLQTVMLKNHDNEKDTAVLAGRDITEPTSRLYLFISSAMAIIACISLIVGGIGIMNIMLVSVAERTREIGLRKAVGSSNGMIVTQFMIEALIISVLGGVVGYLSGYFIAFSISMLLPYDPTFSWHIAGYALGLAVGVGVLFGLYPAVRASRKDPIESLRRYR